MIAQRVIRRRPDPSPSAPSPAASEAAERRCREWYEAHGVSVYNYFRFHVASPDVAEDLTAETFLKVVRAAERFDGDRASPRTWILTVARNVLIDHRRRSRLRQHVPLAGLRDLVYEAPSPEERLLREEEVGRLLGALATLPERDRELLGLRYGSGLEIAEIASVLGIREGGARTRLWRALGRLREALDA
ncbi:MAG TPA: RNA polymerase sigma factor [Gemmatimonadales bacterium]|nr:RNA polymerase sigma factor [Gemmatimonadales bacterium]